MDSTRITYDEALALLREVFASSLPNYPPPDRSAALFGPDAQLDSMELVNFVVDVEEAVSDKLGVELVLADERALSRSKSPFRDLSALAEYLQERLADG